MWSTFLSSLFLCQKNQKNLSFSLLVKLSELCFQTSFKAFTTLKKIKAQFPLKVWGTAAFGAQSKTSPGAGTENKHHLQPQ